MDRAFDRITDMVLFVRSVVRAAGAISAGKPPAQRDLLQLGLAGAEFSHLRR